MISICLAFGAAIVVGEVIASQIGRNYVAQFEAIVARFAWIIGKNASTEVTSALKKIDIAKRVTRMLSSLGSSLTNLGLVILYVLFMLFEHRHFPHKVVVLMGDAGEQGKFNKVAILLSKDGRFAIAKLRH